MQKLPLGIQTFEKIRSGDYLYIDKTDIAYEIIENYQYIFLSRPRRFGKSLFLDTLKNIFEANKELFSGLDIEDKWNWNISYPVITVSFASGKIEDRKSLDQKIIDILKDNQRRLGIKCENVENISGCFSELIQKANEKYKRKVVVLVDEYDKPILDNITNEKIASEIRDGLVNFYSVIKGSDEFLRFAFLTGVSKFTRTSIFSGLNNITDISLDAQFGNVCGYSQNDLETTFLPYLKNQDFDKIKEWYNGYNFLKDDMYNPFDVLHFIQKGYMFKNYWFESGTPTFLIELIKKYNYFIPNLSNLKVGEELLNSFDIGNLNLEVILYQAGYLTIEKMIIDEDFIEYKLKIPNKEVKISLNSYIIQTLFDKVDSIREKKALRDSLKEANFETFETTLKSIFSSIPYNNYTKNEMAHYEGFYASVIYVYLQSLGLNIIGEDVTNQGRIDLTIVLEDKIYIIEFKVGNENALEQIKDKNYHEKYISVKKDIFLVGINFDESKRNVSKVEWVNIT